MAALLAVTQPPARRPFRRHLIRLSISAGAGAALIWMLGLGWFLWLPSRGDRPPAMHADAIVALTGGPDRVEVALRLLAEGAAMRLLISGAGERTELDVLAHHAGIDPGPLEQRVTLGHAAHSTRGNAIETAFWVRDHKIRSLLVVTAWFHIPRAMVELRRAMPEVAVLPYPVGRFSAADLGHPMTARRVIGEYHKYLAALAGITAWPLAARTASAG